MKEVVMIFAMLITLAAGVEMLPLMGSNRKLAKIEGFLGEKEKGEKEKEKTEPTKKLPKHNLNNGQLKRMHFLKYIDKV
jgi:hypothetical protein